MKLPVYFCLAMLLLVGNSMCLAGLNISPHRYDQAQLLHLPKPHYPPKARREGREGWVILSLVVDSQGNPKNPIVIDTVGSKQFASRALAAARQAKFKPAQLNGKTVSASNVRVRVDFALTRPGFKRAGVSKVFNQHYRRAERFLKSRNLSKATRAIQHLEQTYTRNNSEQLWLSLLKARLFFYRGHANGQIQQLQRSLALPAVEFSKQLHQKILADLYRAQIANDEIAEALLSAEAIAQQPQPNAELQHILQHRQQLLQRLERLPELGSQGQILGQHPWRQRLLRRSFSFNIHYGKLDSLELRCRHKQRRFSIDSAQQQWQLPHKWSACTLYVWGQTGSQFELVQHASKSLIPLKSPILVADLNNNSHNNHEQLYSLRRPRLLLHRQSAGLSQL